MPDNQKYQDEINFKEVIKSPMRWFGLIYPYFIVVVIASGIFWLGNQNNVFTNKIQPSTIDTTRLFNELPYVKGLVIPGVDVIKLTSDTQSLASKGTVLFKTNCQSCHGAEGMGDGAAGASLSPKPRNFHSSLGWTNGREIANMYRTLQDGVKGTGMAAYDYLPIEDRFSLIYYIRTLSNDFPQVTNSDLTHMDSIYSLSQGRKTPNQVPIPIARTRLIIEENALLDTAISLENKAHEMVNTEGWKVFDKYCPAKQAAFLFLLRNQVWKTSNKALLEYIYQEIPQNGFKTEVLLINSVDCESLRQFLMKIFS
jgi:mono/diheme cytochrome c family protein